MVAAMAARSTPALRRQYTQSGGDLSQARAVVQCVVCREISKGGNYSYYQYKKQEVTRRRCRMCTMRFREQQRVACLSTFGRVVEGIPMQHSVAKGNFAQVMFDIERGVSLAARERAVRGALEVATPARMFALTRDPFRCADRPHCFARGCGLWRHRNV